MKIEMGESLFYSWLRHVKNCQIVQNNWKTSPEWPLLHEEDLENLWNTLGSDFKEKFGYEVFKKTSSLSQFLQQAECDALGICIQDDSVQYYAVDVAFHESGLKYGSRDETVGKVVTKCIRTALCLYGYMNTRVAEIVFASPKIGKNILEGDNGVNSCIEYLNQVFKKEGFDFTFRIIYNDEFKTKVLDPILLASDDVADTAELFMRGYQLLSMFESEKTKTKEELVVSMDSYEELKIGKLAQTALRDVLENGSFTPQELDDLQTKDYSKKVFGFNYPLLVAADKKDGARMVVAANEEYESRRFYAAPVKINGEKFYMCSQWVKAQRNDLLTWIKKHKKS